jgi:TrmH family RNA methyltransferase
MFLSSSSNSRIKAIRALRHRKEREITGSSFIEGFHLLRAAHDSDVPIETIIACPERITRPLIWDWLAEQRKCCVPILEVSAPVFETLTTKDSEQGIGAVVRQRWSSLTDLGNSSSGCVIALEAVQYPGNLGTILRTADAVGASGVLLLDNATDPYDPQAVRASKGAVFTQRLVRIRSDEFILWKQEQGRTVVAATPESPQDFRTASYTPPLVLLLGRERDGISPELLRFCDTTVRIPMRGKCDSLNLAIAAGILLYAILDEAAFRGG